MLVSLARLYALLVAVMLMITQERGWRNHGLEGEESSEFLML
jgi:hypothetical protein